MTAFYAQPYPLDHTGFYFDSLEDFETGIKRLYKLGCEEVEIQFIDGNAYLSDLAKAAGIHQGNVHLWFEMLDNLDESAARRLTFLLDVMDYSLEDALERYDDVCLYEGKASDYAFDLFEELYDIPDHLNPYIDYNAIAQDMDTNGEIIEIRHDCIVTNASEF